MNVATMRTVAKRYGDHVVLDGLDLGIERGEVFALLGPNGSGKTTTVEILEGYRRADAGSVKVLGHDPAMRAEALRARIGVVLQHTTAFEHVTVGELVELFAALYPAPLSAGDVIRSVGLESKVDEVAATLSGGQRRRLDVACGIVGRPDLLFLDEPTTGLDPVARRELWMLIAGLREQGTTIVLTTHYLEEAEALADRIGVLLGGRLAAVGTPGELVRHGRACARVSFMPPAGVPEFDAWDRHGRSVWVDTDRPTELVASLAATHGELAGLVVRRPSLEDVYLEMVARWGQADEVSA